MCAFASLWDSFVPGSTDRQQQPNDPRESSDAQLSRGARRVCVWMGREALACTFRTVQERDVSENQDLCILLPRRRHGKALLRLVSPLLNHAIPFRMTSADRHQFLVSPHPRSCDVYLTHDSVSVRKAHNSGRNHLQNVRDYYQSLDPGALQMIMEDVHKEYDERGIEKPAVGPPAPGGFGGPGGGKLRCTLSNHRAVN